DSAARLVCARDGNGDYTVALAIDNAELRDAAGRLLVDAAPVEEQMPAAGALALEGSAPPCLGQAQRLFVSDEALAGDSYRLLGGFTAATTLQVYDYEVTIHSEAALLARSGWQRFRAPDDCVDAAEITFRTEAFSVFCDDGSVDFDWAAAYPESVTVEDSTHLCSAVSRGDGHVVADEVP